MKLKKYRQVLSKYFAGELLLFAMLIYFIFNFNQVETWLRVLMPTSKEIVEWAPLWELALEYGLVVLLSSLASFLIAFSLGVVIHIYRLKELKDLMLLVTDFGTTFPTVALMALFVPVLGYGFEPVVAALVIYGLLPILTNTLKGLEEVDEDVRQAAIGMGMNRVQLFAQVELPLAMPMIIAGVRTSVIINIAAATVGSAVGAGGLGVPIVSGIRSSEPIQILKGTVPVALIAMIMDRLFYRMEVRYQWK